MVTVMSTVATMPSDQEQHNAASIIVAAPTTTTSNASLDTLIVGVLQDEQDAVAAAATTVEAATHTEVTAVAEAAAEAILNQQHQQQNDDEIAFAEDAAAVAATAAAVAAVVALEESTAMVLEDSHTAAAIVAAESGSSILHEDATQLPPPDALAAMQEAATLVMQAREQAEAAKKSCKRKADSPPTPPQPDDDGVVAVTDGPPVEQRTWPDVAGLASQATGAGDSNNSNKNNEETTIDGALTEQMCPDGTDLPSPNPAIVAAAVTPVATALSVAAAAADIAAVVADGQPPRKKRAPPTRLSWEDRIKQLKEYKAKHGNLLIPIRFKANPSLGKFVHNTREQYKLFYKKSPEGYKKKCSLTLERITELEDIGFMWTTERTKRQDEDWQSRIQQLEEYKAKHGHCLVPHGYPDDPSFAEWVHRCRTTYAGMHKEEKPSPLVKSRMDQLVAMGFSFTVHTDRWMDHWNELKEYKEKHGNCLVPTHYSENLKLGRWVHTQRHQRRLKSKGKKSCLTDERVAMLDDIGFSWEVRPGLERPRATWLTRFDELTKFHKTHQHFCVPADTMPQLNKWCQEQKQRLKLLEKNEGSDKSKRMGPDRVNALQAIGFHKNVELAPVAAGTTNINSSSNNSAADSTAMIATTPATSIDVLGAAEPPVKNSVQV